MKRLEAMHETLSRTAEEQEKVGRRQDAIDRQQDEIKLRQDRRSDHSFNMAILKLGLGLLATGVAGGNVINYETKLSKSPPPPHALPPLKDANGNILPLAAGDKSGADAPFPPGSDKTGVAWLLDRQQNTSKNSQLMAELALGIGLVTIASAGYDLHYYHKRKEKGPNANAKLAEERAANPDAARPTYSHQRWPIPFMDR